MPGSSSIAPPQGWPNGYFFRYESGIPDFDLVGQWCGVQGGGLVCVCVFGGVGMENRIGSQLPTCISWQRTGYQRKGFRLRNKIFSMQYSKLHVPLVEEWNTLLITPWMYYKPSKLHGDILMIPWSLTTNIHPKCQEHIIASSRFSRHNTGSVSNICLIRT